MTDDRQPFNASRVLHASLSQCWAEPGLHEVVLRLSGLPHLEDQHVTVSVDSSGVADHAGRPVSASGCRIKPQSGIHRLVRIDIYTGELEQQRVGHRCPFLRRE